MRARLRPCLRSLGCSSRHARGQIGSARSGLKSRPKHGLGTPTVNSSGASPSRSAFGGPSTRGSPQKATENKW
eukprot:10162752-Alexandrium_andersonii.AAC.1